MPTDALSSARQGSAPVCGCVLQCLLTSTVHAPTTGNRRSATEMYVISDLTAELLQERYRLVRCATDRPQLPETFATMGNVQSGLVYRKLAKEIPPVKTMGHDDNWNYTNVGWKVFEDDRDREQFICRLFLAMKHL